MIRLKINDQRVDAEEGTTVLQAAASIGVIIPTLCYHKDLSPFGGCRLCVVDIQGGRLPMTACNLPVSSGLTVQTETPTIVRYRRAVLRMLLSNYYDAGYKRLNGEFGPDENNELARWCQVYDVDIRQSMAKKPLFPVDSDPNPFVWVDMNKCIQCTRCVRACGEVQGRFVWSQSYRGYRARIVAGADSTMLASRCESCGACVVYCPTGALDNKMSVSAGIPDRVLRSTCTYCGVGCQLELNVKEDVPGGRVMRVTSDTETTASSVNGLHLCLKGRYGYEFIHHPHRQTHPRVRQYLLEGGQRPDGHGNGSAKGTKLVEVDWDTALDLAARGLRQVRDEYGGESVAVLASGKLLNEENYLLNKLARQVLGSNHIDCCANLYSASVVDGLMETVGLPAMSNSFQDIAQQAQSLLVIGSNLTEQHPVFGAQIRQAVLRRKLKLVIASPDFVNIAEYAALDLRHQPNTETALVNGLMHIILEKGWQDQACIEKYPQGFAETRSVIDQYPPQRVAQITGVSVESLYQAAEILAQHRPAAVLWSLGLADPMMGRHSVHALASLQLLLGNLDRPGGGLNPLRSQNNIQGACDLGALPDMLPGYQAVMDPIARHHFEQAWGMSLPSQPGMKAAEIMSAAGQGRIKALYIVGEEVINTSPQGAQVRRALDACDFVVLQESLASEAVRYADVLLPGVTFAEKSGTFTSSERRIQLVRQAIQPLGEARPDWEIIANLARRIIAGGKRPLAGAAYADWEYAETEQIMQEITALTPIYAGVSISDLAHGKRVQWPVDASGAPGTPLLQVGAFSDGLVQWIPAEQTPAQEESLAEAVIT